MTTEIKISDMKIGDKVVAIGFKCNMDDYRQTFTVAKIVTYDPATSGRSPHSPRVCLLNQRGELRFSGGRDISSNSRSLANLVYFTRAE